MKITKARLRQIIKEELEVVLTNEEVEEMFGEEVRAQVEAMEEEIDERKLTEPEKKEKEKVVKGMKKSKGDFKKRYGDDAESVMYATATKIAKDKK
jgi:Glu-tRNA(Gln) amidotransferase subunit E-like FAD-binding protein